MAAVAVAVDSISNVAHQPDSVAQHNRNLENALNFFSHLDPTTSLRGNVKLHLAVDEITRHSMGVGLNPRQITTLVNVILDSSSKLSQAIRTKFIKCLIPSSKVPQEAVVQVLAHISSRIFTSPGPSNLHSWLLRWVLLVFDHIDGYDQLHKLYSVVFCFLNSHRLLPHACHLLFLLTTKRDIRLFRVHKLLEIIKSVGPEPYIMGLLMIYKVYSPHLVSMKLEFNHKVFFKAHDATWRSTIETIVKQREVTDDVDTRCKVSEIQNRREKARIQPRSKRQKLMIPESHTAAHEIEDKSGETSESLIDATNTIPYTQIESFTGFLEAIDKVEFPSQVAACLGDTRLQLLLTCNPDPLLMARLCFWIQHIFVFGFKRTEKGCVERNEKLLHMLFTFSKNVQGLPVLFGFLESWLPTWDGQSYAPLIFSLISCLRPSSYNELHSSILEPLQRIFFSSDVYSKTMCIAALTKLIENLTRDERLKPACIPAKAVAAEGSLSQTQGLSGGDAGDMNRQESGQATASECDENVADMVCRLINFLDVVIVTGMRAEDDHYLLQASSLDLLQLISEMCLKYNVPLVCLPMRLIHRLLLSDCCATLARLCGIINTFREAFVLLKSSSRKHGVSLACTTTCDFPSKSVNNSTEKFNALLLDVLGMLWQGRLFSDRKDKYESIFRVQLPSCLEGKLNDSALTVYRGPAFLGLAYTFLKETQREGKQVHPLQIEDFKETYLLFLQRENFPEFMQLVNTNIKRRKK
ncbi:unnamed protein product [Candidula unifasciata]|uniref:Uncharacterized protein n=1 Tax=Candidula unifasciata TaxID=100452 RepID=A0A8S3ZUX5_9EUPU|nr:unnamed protein product [Candidula unifasciata]